MTGIDELYKLPLDEFTAARNALAKSTGDASIKKLVGKAKPEVAEATEADATETAPVIEEA